MFILEVIASLDLNNTAPYKNPHLRSGDVTSSHFTGTSEAHGVETTVHTDAVTVWLVHEYENYLVPPSYHWYILHFLYLIILLTLLIMLIILIILIPLIAP